MNIIEITDDLEKQRAARLVLEDLTDWFGIASSREEHILNSAGKPFFCAYQQEKPIGFLYLKETSNATMELAVMGVLKEHHRKGIGRALFECAKESARKKGFSFLQVKTVRMGMYEEYDRTNRFYLSLGFKEFEVFPMFWDERNPCQIYIMAL
jgi:GNAT superfamily N-acetyltransferase